MHLLSRRCARFFRPAIVTSLFVALLLLALPALAQGDLPTISAGNPNPQKLLGYFVLIYILDSSLLRALAPDNTSLPFSLSPTALHWINGVGSVVLTICSATIGGQPWEYAIGSGVLNFFVASTHVGAAKGAWQAIACGAGGDAALKARACKILGIAPAAPAVPPAPPPPKSS